MSRPTPKQMRLLIGSARRYARGASELLALVSLPCPPDLFEFLIKLSAEFNTVLRAVSDLTSAIDRTWKGGEPSINGWPDAVIEALFVIYYRFKFMMGEIQSGLDENGLSWDEVGLPQQSRGVGMEPILPVCMLGNDGPWIEGLLSPESLWRPLFERGTIDAIDSASAALEQACGSILEEPAETTQSFNPGEGTAANRPSWDRFSP